MSFPASMARALRKEIQTDLSLSLPSKVRGLSDSSLHTFFIKEVAKSEHLLIVSIEGDDDRGGALGRVSVVPSSLALKHDDDDDNDDDDGCSSMLLLRRCTRR
jgi:hypothetical protein